MSSRTVLFGEHVKLGGRMVDFHGWELPVQYEGILSEHVHCRQAACVFDTSHMGQLLIRARPSELGRVVTQHATALPVGRSQYGFLLNEAGGILDDTVLMRLGGEEFLLVVNAGPAQSDFEWVCGHLPSGHVALQSAQGWGKVDLQGPLSARVLRSRTDADLSRLGYYGVTRAKVCGCECVLSRTGYTGELGYEVLAPAESILTIFRELVADPTVKPAGLGARDSLRLEMGYPLYGEDIDTETNPLEAGLGEFVRFDHDFVGSAALRAVLPRRRRVTFVVDSRQRPGRGDEIWHEGHAVGHLTSAAFSPSLSVSIGMGYVPVELSRPGLEMVVKTQRRDLSVRVAKWPLYRRGTHRTREL